MLSGSRTARPAVRVRAVSRRRRSRGINTTAVSTVVTTAASRATATARARRTSTPPRLHRARSARRVRQREPAGPRSRNRGQTARRWGDHAESGTVVRSSSSAKINVPSDTAIAHRCGAAQSRPSRSAGTRYSPKSSTTVPVTEAPRPRRSWTVSPTAHAGVATSPESFTTTVKQTHC